MMRNRGCYILLAAFLSVLLFSASITDADAELIRKPVWAGKFYPGSKADLLDTIRHLTRKAEKSPLPDAPSGKLKALILPHAGYIYSGWTAAHASRVLKGRRFSKVLLLGPDHRVGFRNGAVSEAKAWETPIGLVRLHNDARSLVKGSDRYKPVPESDAMEHSLEVILPFLQVYLNRFELVPVVLGPGSIDRIAGDLDPLLDENTLLVISSDLSHYLSYDEAVSTDRETLRTILNLSAEAFSARHNAACGRNPILVGMNLARRHGWHPQLLHYANSGDTAGGKDRVVGYAAIAFYGDAMDDQKKAREPLSDTNGQVLVRLARRTIEEKLGSASQIPKEDKTLLASPRFDNRRGTFVTLKIGGDLRGCIGSLTADESLREGVKRNAINAAFRDPRFGPLTAAELDQVDIEVSILTEPRELEFTDGDDLISKLRPNIDGVIIKKGFARSTFLPQVWEQLPGPEAFLSHLCRKAGLPADAWQQPGLKVSTYQVQYFEEHR